MTALPNALASRGRHSKVPPTIQLTNNRSLFSHSSGGQSQKLRCWWGQGPSEGFIPVPTPMSAAFSSCVPQCIQMAFL